MDATVWSKRGVRGKRVREEKTDMKFPISLVSRLANIDVVATTYLIPPGSTLTRTPTIVFATGKTLVSKTFIDPPARGVAAA